MSLTVVDALTAFAEMLNTMGELTYGFPGPCVVIAQGERETARRSGVYPGRAGA